jgi:hypothetical protein
MRRDVQETPGRVAGEGAMKIRSHSELHIVELEDGSQWKIFPGDLDVTLDWEPETELTVLPVEDKVCSHSLIHQSGAVRAIPVGETWPLREVKSVLRNG